MKEKKRFETWAVTLHGDRVQVELCTRCGKAIEEKRMPLAQEITDRLDEAYRLNMEPLSGAIN
jgi:hypothetical protein